LFTGLSPIPCLGELYVLRTLRTANLSEAPGLHALRRVADAALVPADQPAGVVSRGAVQLRDRYVLAAQVHRHPPQFVLSYLALALGKERCVWLGSRGRWVARLGLLRSPKKQAQGEGLGHAQTADVRISRWRYAHDSVVDSRGSAASELPVCYWSLSRL